MVAGQHREAEGHQHQVKLLLPDHADALILQFFSAPPNCQQVLVLKEMFCNAEGGRISNLFERNQNTFSLLF